MYLVTTVGVCCNQGLFYLNDFCVTSVKGSVVGCCWCVRGKGRDVSSVVTAPSEWSLNEMKMNERMGLGEVTDTGERNECGPGTQDGIKESGEGPGLFGFSTMLVQTSLGAEYASSMHQGKTKVGGLGSHAFLAFV